MTAFPLLFKFLSILNHKTFNNYNWRCRYEEIYSFSLSYYTRIVNFEVFQTIRSYLLKIYMGYQNTHFQLEELFSYISPGLFTIPSVIGFDPLDNIISYDNALLAVIRYKDRRYFVSSTAITDRTTKIYFLIISGENLDELYSVELANLIIKEAIRNSGYFSKFLRLLYDDFADKISFKLLPKLNLTLNDIYLKDKSELQNFIEAVKTKSQVLRYLSVGEPGTGKTDTIRAIISECLKTNGITVIVVDSSCKVPLSLVFEYAEIFSPVFLCIDDIDILVGSRNKVFSKHELSSALEALDGFITKEENFLIVTTNDREFVDVVLRRPGRFDFILEFKELDPEFCPELVFRESKDELLSEVFKNEIITRKLANIKATGAFIVTLVKHLLKPRYENFRYDPQVVLNLIEKLQKAFKSEMKIEESIGF